jgi:alpha-1,6-mannosyltransferase
VTTFYGPESGGVKTYLDAKMEALAGSDVVHRLVVPGEEHGTHRVRDSRVYRVGAPSIPFSPGYRLLTSPRTLERILAREEPDVVEIGSPFVTPFLVRRARGDREFRTVGFYHSDLLRTYVDPYVGQLGEGARRMGRSVARRFIRHVYGNLDVTVAASRSVANELRELGLGNVEAVPLGVDLELFHPRRRGGAFRRQLGVPGGVPIALFAGRFVREKGLPTLLDGHGRVPVDRRPHLVLVGRGAMREKLEEIAGRRARLTVLDYVSGRETIAEMYASSEYYVAPGPGETFGLSIAEALASGLPVVSVDAGAGPDRVRGSGCARLYAPGDPGACADALAWMAAHQSAKMRERARAHAEAELGWDRTFQRLRRLYRALAGGGNGHGGVPPAPAGERENGEDPGGSAT